MIRVALLLILLALPASAEEVVAGLSQNRVSITTSFEDRSRNTTSRVN